LYAGRFLSQGAHQEASTSNIIVRWNAPPPGAVKLNFDGSLSYSSAAGGFIIRDWSGHLIKAGAAHYGESSILIAEARALRDGVKVAAELGVKHLFIEGDNATIIRALRGDISSPWTIAALIQDVLIWLSTIISISISHVYRGLIWSLIG